MKINNSLKWIIGPIFILHFFLLFLALYYFSKSSSTVDNAISKTEGIQTQLHHGPCTPQNEEEIDLEEWTKRILNEEQTPRMKLADENTETYIEWEKKRRPQLWTLTYLSDLEALETSLDDDFSIKLAKASKRYASYRKGKGFCLKGVRLALNNVLIKYIEGLPPTHDLNKLPADEKHRKTRTPGRSAHSFLAWAEQNPVSLCRKLKLAKVNHLPDMFYKRGNIHIYAKGSCGFNRKFGHIEIVTNPETKEVCSDHCRVTSESCQPDIILAPVKSCDWLIHYSRNIEDNFDFFEKDYFHSRKKYYFPTWRTKTK